MPTTELSFLDVCSGAGGLALGLEQAGFEPVLLLDDLKVACETLHLNRPDWDVLNMDLLEFVPDEHRQVYDVDLLSAGLPRVDATATGVRPDSIGVKLLNATMDLLSGVQPAALLIENVPDLVQKSRYRKARANAEKELEHLGYRCTWFVIDAADYGVPQHRKQGILVAFKGDLIDAFEVPKPLVDNRITAGEALKESMASRGWPHAAEWAAGASQIAPTIVGGSPNRGGADLGPTGSKKAWAKLGVDGRSLADELPDAGHQWQPGDLVKLTIEQAAHLQAFPHDWRFSGGKTARYRQVGHASPPPVGRVLGEAIRVALGAR